jgi:hypothetical protein
MQRKQYLKVQLLFADSKFAVDEFMQPLLKVVISGFA